MIAAARGLVGQKAVIGKKRVGGGDRKAG